MGTVNPLVDRVQNSGPLKHTEDSLNIGSPVEFVTNYIVNSQLHKVSNPNNLPYTDGSADHEIEVGFATALVMDTNIVTAQIGSEDSDSRVTVKAEGDITVEATSETRPDLTATSFVNNEASLRKDVKEGKTDKAGSISLAVGLFEDDVDALIHGNADVDAEGILSVDARALNDIQYDNLWGKNLTTELYAYSDFHTEGKWELEEGTYNTPVQTISNGDTVTLLDNVDPENGIIGNRYEYIGSIPTREIDLSTENYFDESQWTNLGTPGFNNAAEFSGAFSRYYSGDLGLDRNLFDSVSRATAKGDEMSVAASITYLQLDHQADAIIKSGANINQNPELDSFA